MPDNTSWSPKKMAVGAALRQAREDAEVGLGEFAARIGKDKGWLSRVETGKRQPKATDVAQILTALGVNGERYDEILELASNADEPRWLAVSLPEQRQQLAAMLEFERTASTITDVSPLLIPGVLQTSSYVRSIMVTGGVPRDEVETRVAVRLGRRETISRKDNPARLIACIGESALRQEIGSPDVMREQLRHLLDVAEWPNVDLRVVPRKSGWHPGLEGPFTLIDSTERPAVVHLENRRSGLFLHEEEDVATYRQAAEMVLRVAISPADSSGLIADIANEME